MEPASVVLGKLVLGKPTLPGETLTVEDLVRAAWPAAVGKRIALHTHAAKLVRTRLVVEVEDAVWQRQLMTLSRQILSNLENGVGPGYVDDLEFRVTPLRIGPGRAESATPAPAMRDEADDIADPILRRIYRQSKRRALA